MNCDGLNRLRKAQNRHRKALGAVFPTISTATATTNGTPITNGQSTPDGPGIAVFSAKSAGLAFCLIITFFCCDAIQVLAQAAAESARDPDTKQSDLPEIYATDFENELRRWEFVDDGWKRKMAGNGHVLSLFKEESNYSPAVRSPKHLALVKDSAVTDFRLEVRVRSTESDYDHRDACLFFGYQSPTQYYYVHLGKKTDQHANQIFIVNNAPRTKISSKTNDGTPWDERWHKVRLTRNTKTGYIEVYFDDMNRPSMTAQDKTFAWGRVGVGSFDDRADWDDFKLNGIQHNPPNR